MSNWFVKSIWHLVQNRCSNTIRAGVAGNFNVQVWVIVGEKLVRLQIFVYFDEWFMSFRYSLSVPVFFFFRSSFKGARKLCILGIIIIMSCRQHGYPWPSLATSPNHSSPPAGLQGYILCLHIAAVCRFVLVVLLLLGHMWGSIGVHHLRARPCFSSSVLRVWFV